MQEQSNKRNLRNRTRIQLVVMSAGFQFGDFTWLCERAALTICPLLQTPQGVMPTCYARNVILGSQVWFQPATSFVHVAALAMTAIMLFHVSSKYTAIGRKEIVMFFYIYMFCSLLAFFLDSTVIPTSHEVYAVSVFERRNRRLGMRGVVSRHHGLVKLMMIVVRCRVCWISRSVILVHCYERSRRFPSVGRWHAKELMGTWNDPCGRPLPMPRWPCKADTVQLLRLSCLVVWGVCFFVSIATFKSWASFSYTRPLGLFVTYIVFPLVCVVFYMVSQLILVIRTLDDRWVIGDIIFGIAFYVIGCVILVAFSNTICNAVSHYIDGVFFFSLCMLLTVMMVYKVSLARNQTWHAQ